MGASSSAAAGPSSTSTSQPPALKPDLTTRCSVCASSDTPDRLLDPEKDKSCVELVWDSSGKLLLPTPPSGLTPEERAGFDQEMKDLAEGLAKKSMPVKKQPIYRKQVLLQEEELLEMYATNTAQAWALEGGGDTNRKKN